MACAFWVWTCAEGTYGAVATAVAEEIKSLCWLLGDGGALEGECRGAAGMECGVWVVVCRYYTFATKMPSGHQ